MTFPRDAGLLQFFRKRLRRVATMAYFGTIPREDHVQFIGRGPLYFNPADNRGLWLQSTAGVTQPLVTWLWRTVVDSCSPDLVVDVGANYGEIALSSRYLPNTRIVLVEPNPDLLPFLTRSSAQHVNSAQITLAPILASDVNGAARFEIDEKWSGTSSVDAPVRNGAFKGLGPQRSRVVDATAATLDSLLHDIIRPTDQRLLVKIDVEGHEIRVLKGLAQTLERFADWAILVEYNRTAIAVTGRSEESVFNVFAGCGEVHLVSAEPYLRRVSHYAQVPGNQADLVLTSRTAPRNHCMKTFRLPFALRRLRQPDTPADMTR